MKMLLLPFQKLAESFWRRLEFPYREMFVNQDVALDRGRMLVVLTYLIWFTFCLQTFRDIDGWSTNLPAQLLWNVRWVQYVPLRPVAIGLVSLACLSTLLAAKFPQTRTLRILAFLSIFEFQAIIWSSRGKIDHPFHPFLLALLVMIFLPRLTQDSGPKKKRAYLQTIWGVQAVAFACYTVAGLQKLNTAWADWDQGPTVFDPTAIPRQLAWLAIRGEGAGLLSPFMITYAHLAYPLMWGTLFLETFAIFAVFRPRLHAFWALGLIGMHTGISLIMNIWFGPMVMMVGMWFLYSPFATQPFHLNATLRDIPWLGPFISPFHSRFSSRSSRNRVIVFYDGECGICSRFVRVLIRAGVPDNFYFASQQSQAWQLLLEEKPYLRNVNSAAVLTEEGGERQVRLRNEAILWSLVQLAFPHAIAGAALLIPQIIRDPGYRVIAFLRRRLSSSLSISACPLPTEGMQGRILG